MEPPPDVQNPTSSPRATALEATRRARAEDTLWMLLGTLLRRWKFIFGGTFVAGVAAIVLSLVLPVWYQATAKVIIPESRTDASIATLLDNLGPGAAAFLTGSPGDFTRYQAILTSRSVRENVVRTFNLVEVYGTANHDTPLEEALALLEANTDLELDLEFEYLVIRILDQDPQRAADMANFLVDQLNTTNARLTSNNAAKNRAFMEQRYRNIEIALDSARAALQAFQEQYGVIELDLQVEGFLTMMAGYRTQALLGEITYESQRRNYGDDNPTVQSAYNRVLAAQQKERELRGGSDAFMPIAFNELPDRARQYAELKQDLLIQANMIELVRPLLEKARFDEAQATPAVQVLDRAVPPFEKAKPQRTVLVVALTFLGGVLVVLYVLLSEWWRRNRAFILFQVKGAA